MMNTVKNLGIEVINLINNTFCNDLVLNAGQHNYFEMFLVAFAVEVKTTLMSSFGENINEIFQNIKTFF